MTPKGFLFELSGGALCLDFVNTVDYRPTTEPKELLGDYADLLSWAQQAGALTPAEASALRHEAARRSREAAAVLQRARALRERLFALFSSSAATRRLPAATLHSLGPEVAAALARLQLSPTAEGGARWTWPDDSHELDRVLWPVLGSVASLLTSPDLTRVRECAASSCAWLFVDRSRNRSRRWCDMTVCGNRDKVRRHRQREGT